MNEIASIGDKLTACGFQFKTVNIKHVPELLETIAKLERAGAFAKPVAGDYIRYYTDVSNQPPAAQTLFIIAMPSPITHVNFTLPDGILTTVIPPQYIGGVDDAAARDCLLSVLEPAGYKIARARVPMKTLAVRSGLARYGRNNISYVPGMGSFHRLIAFSAEVPSVEDNWQEAKMMAACENCYRCRENCPTGAIATDRFQIHAERCLTYLNESPANFPGWVKPEWHNALIGCMRCQDICPVNKPYLKKVKKAPGFDAGETDLILKKTPFKELPAETQRKLRDIAYDDTWLYRFLARNLAVLIKR